MKLNRQQVAHIAELARLAPDTVELEMHVRDLARILDLVDVLRQSPADAPLRYPAGSKLRLRLDEVRTDCGSGPGTNAPESAGDYYLVPRFIE